MTRLFKLGLDSFLVYLSYGKIQYLISIANMFDFTHQKLYLLYLVILLQHVFITFAASIVLLWYLYLLYQLFCCSTFLLYLPCQLLYQLNLFCRSSPISLLLCVLLLTRTNHYPAISIYTYTLYFMFCKIYFICIYVNMYKYIQNICIYIFENMLTHLN